MTLSYKRTDVTDRKWFTEACGVIVVLSCTPIDDVWTNHKGADIVSECVFAFFWFPRIKGAPHIFNGAPQLQSTANLAPNYSPS